MDLKKINQKIKNFVKERDWDQFHSPKNLSMALSVEASELVEIFQWLKESDLKKVEKEKVADEIADIFFYLLRISQKQKQILTPNHTPPNGKSNDALRDATP